MDYIYLDGLLGSMLTIMELNGIYKVWKFQFSSLFFLLTLIFLLLESSGCTDSCGDLKYTIKTTNFWKILELEQSHATQFHYFLSIFLDQMFSNLSFHFWKTRLS